MGSGDAPKLLLAASGRQKGKELEKNTGHGMGWQSWPDRTLGGHRVGNKLARRCGREAPVTFPGELTCQCFQNFESLHLYPAPTFRILKKRDGQLEGFHADLALHIGLRAYSAVSHPGPGDIYRGTSDMELEAYYW